MTDSGGVSTGSLTVPVILIVLPLTLTVVSPRAAAIVGAIATHAPTTQ